MKQSLLLLITLFFILQAGEAQRRKSKATENFTIQQLAPGVWAAIQNDQFGKAICNAGIIDLGDKTLVFDPFMNPSAAKELRNTAEDLTGKPVMIVVNSHYHNDHVRGNQVFAPYVTIISSTYTRNQIAKTEPEEQSWEKRHVAALLQATKKRYASSAGMEREELPLWIGYYEGIMESMGDLELTLPNMVFNDSLWIMGTRLEVKLVEYKNCHTGSDVALYIPSLGIAFMGDLLFVKRQPWLCDGDPGNWEATLNNLMNDATTKTYVPGHGPVAEKAAINEMNNYLKTMQDLSIAANNDSLQSLLLIQPLPSPYRDWYFTRFYEPNMKYLFSRNKNTTVRKDPD
ncbi:MAG TPA: MBL fold metallo-hydrolase [Chitinophagaceae bacterium]|nr:MBL fold metallo-hydrolase [Chitinophagaceae bacterium]